LELPNLDWRNAGLVVLDEGGTFPKALGFEKRLGLAVFALPKPEGELLDDVALPNKPKVGVLWAGAVEVVGGVFIALPNVVLKPEEGLLVLSVLPNPDMLGLPNPVLKPLLGWTGGLAAVNGVEGWLKEKLAKGLVFPWLPVLPTELFEAVLIIRRFGTAMGRSGWGLLFWIKKVENLRAFFLFVWMFLFYLIIDYFL
jgi:hypothetical protein